MITLQDIWNSSELTMDAKLWARDNLEYLNKPMRYFGSSQKVEKGADKRDTYILYLQPADKVATRTLCAMADASGCKDPCLISSGQLGMSTGQRAATKRTILLLLDRVAFEAQLRLEVAKAERKVLKTGIPALFRLNGTSDLNWDTFIRSCPASEFYDYTKVLSSVRKNTLENYHLTFSGSMYSTQSRVALRKAIERRYNIAVAFNTKGLSSDNVEPTEGMTSFDTTDLRPLDAAGTIGYLKRKGSNKTQRALEGNKSFFVTRDNIADFHDILAVAS